MANFEILHDNSATQKELTLNIDRGQNTVSNFSIRNNDSSPLKIKLSVKPAHLTEFDQLSLTPDKSQQSLDQWISLPQTELTVPANSTLPINLKLQIPEQATVGEHHAIIIATPIETQTNEGIQIIQQKGLHVVDTVTTPHTSTDSTHTTTTTEPQTPPPEISPILPTTPALILAGLLTATIFAIILRKLLPKTPKKLKFIGALSAFTAFTIFLFPTFAQQDEIYSTNNNYLTIQWGNVNQVSLPRAQKSQNWDFTISSPDAKISVDTHLDFENNDQTDLIDQNTIGFRTTTNDEVDGAILLMEFDKTTDPLFKFTDNITKKEISLYLSELKHEQIFFSGRQSIHFLASDMYYKAKRFFIYSQEEDLQELLDATPDLEAFLEIPATPQIDVAEIQKIFSQLPATYENFNELRPEYDLIHKIIAASGQVSVYADPILITELAASPELLRAIATDPERSIAFFSNRTLVFPTQEFDFNQQKIISIPMNEMLFTHRRPGKWKTYIEASNFVSTSNSNTINATNLCIIPGDIKWITDPANNYFIESKYCFKSNSDQLLLLERVVSDPVTFKIRPTLELKIPKNTPPSVYRGILTFTEI